MSKHSTVHGYTIGVMLCQYNDVIMSAMIAYSTVCSDDQRRLQSSASLAFVMGIHLWPVYSPHKWPVTRKNVSIWWRHHGITLYELKTHQPEPRYCMVGYAHVHWIIHRHMLILLFLVWILFYTVFMHTAALKYMLPTQMNIYRITSDVKSRYGGTQKVSIWLHV